MSAVGAAHCGACGLPADRCPGCARDLDPPRFCERCGRRLTVRVTPAAFVATCPEHGSRPGRTRPAIRP